MQSSVLMASLGLGSAVAFAGAALIGAGAALALSVLIPQIPLAAWLAFCGVGLLVVGLILVERGSARTVEKVEEELSFPKVFANFPWTWAAAGTAAIGLGFLFGYRRRRPQTSLAAIRRGAEKAAEQAAAAVTRGAEKAAEAAQSLAPKKRMTLADVVMPLAAQAASMAAGAGLSALGVPSVDDLLKSVLSGGSNPPGDKKKPEARHSHNGHSRSRVGDAM
jgi:hypothetical protein